MKKNLLSKTIHYNSKFYPSKYATTILKNGRILDKNETPKHMIERVVKTLIEVENKFNTSLKDMNILKKEFGNLLDKKYCVMSTPILTNAGKHLKKPLSACTVPSIDLVYDNIENIRKIIFKTHQDGMGTGFNLDDVVDPIKTLKELNKIAIESSESGKEDRPVGNIATLSVYHPKILEFINTKISTNTIEKVWKFNISINCDKKFFKKLKRDDFITLYDGTQHKAKKILNAISKTAYLCADPGLVFLERMEEDNPTPSIGLYNSTAPCAEVGLAKGESCQFGYINISKFLTKTNEIDIKKLKHATHILTRILDNALEISIENYSEDINKHIMSQKRKIGIGICGLADLLIKKGILYESKEARILALDIVTLINFESKIASYNLAKVRGSFGAMKLRIKNKHLLTPSLIEKKYGKLTTKYVSSKDWQQLSAKIRNTKLLRNASTIALPPTGRSAITIDASTGIEPIFSQKDYLFSHPLLKKKYYQFLQTATNISPNNHILMAAHIQKGVDESISKTINLQQTKTPEEIQNIYVMAWNLGLKGITIYREGSKNLQPKKLS